jgi:hypothetical protein
VPVPPGLFFFVSNSAPGLAFCYYNYKLQARFTFGPTWLTSAASRSEPESASALGPAADCINCMTCS